VDFATIDKAISGWFYTVDGGPTVAGQLRWPLVALSYLMAASASIVALYIAAARRRMDSPFQRWIVMGTGTLALGGAIWGMHFIGMMAFELCAAVRYSPGLTILSGAPALLAAAIALRELERPSMSGRRLLKGGGAVGLGIGVMHYSGMMAMEMAPALRFEPRLFALSIAGAVVLAMLALWVRERVATLGPSWARWRHVVGGLGMGAAITAMHYVGMASARFVGVAETAMPAPAQGRWILTWIVAMGVFGTLGLVAAGVLMLRLRNTIDELRLRERELRTIFHHALDAIITTDARGMVLSVNQSFEWMFDRQADAILGQDVRTLVPQWSELLDEIRAAGAGDSEISTRSLDVRVTRADSTELSLRLSLVRVAEHGLTVDVGFLMDMSEFKRRQDQAERQARVDALTGLWNRSGLDHELCHALALVPHGSGLLALLFIDLDGFKAINDRHGHRAGDEVLVEVARRIRANVRQSDAVARLGGDEFVVLLPGLHDLDAATRVAGNILSQVADRITLPDGQTVRVGCSIGIATAGRGRVTDEASLVAEADAAMYRAKAEGKGRYRIALPSSVCIPQTT